MLRKWHARRKVKSWKYPVTNLSFGFVWNKNLSHDNGCNLRKHLRDIKLFLKVGQLSCCKISRVQSRCTLRKIIMLRFSLKTITELPILWKRTFSFKYFSSSVANCMKRKRPSTQRYTSDKSFYKRQTCKIYCGARFFVSNFLKRSCRVRGINFAIYR